MLAHEAYVHADVLVFTAGARRSSPSIRRFPFVPEAADLLYRILVSSYTFPRAHTLCFRPLTAARHGRAPAAAAAKLAVASRPTRPTQAWSCAPGFSRNP